MPDFDIRWMWRSRLPAKSPPNEAYPYGIALDVTKGQAPACVVKLPYPAQGVGAHIILCRRCGFSVGATAAGRADDPTQITIPCKRRPHATA